MPKPSQYSDKKPAFLKSKCIDLSGLATEVRPKAGEGLAPTAVGVQNWRPQLLKANKHKNF